MITPLSPASWRSIDLAGKDCHSSGDVDIRCVEIIGVVLPVEPRGGGPGVGEPVERDVVEHLVSGKFPFGVAAGIRPSG